MCLVGMEANRWGPCKKGSRRGRGSGSPCSPRDLSKNSELHQADDGSAILLKPIWWQCRARTGEDKAGEEQLIYCHSPDQRGQVLSEFCIVFYHINCPHYIYIFLFVGTSINFKLAGLNTALVCIFLYPKIFLSDIFFMIKGINIYMTLENYR